jgi:hypothetical protein
MNVSPAFGSDGQRKDFSRVFDWVELKGYDGQLMGSKLKLIELKIGPASR